jgi:hypothetical protein
VITLSIKGNDVSWTAIIVFFIETILNCTVRRRFNSKVVDTEGCESVVPTLCFQ